MQRSEANGAGNARAGTHQGSRGGVAAPESGVASAAGRQGSLLAGLSPRADPLPSPDLLDAEHWPHILPLILFTVGLSSIVRSDDAVPSDWRLIHVRLAGSAPRPVSA